MPETRLDVTIDGVSTSANPLSIIVPVVTRPEVADALVGPGTAVGAILDTKSSINHTAVADADYMALITDRQIGFTSLTAPRTVSLPNVDDFPLGETISVGDESGNCGPGLEITIQVGGGTNDTIAGLLSIQISSPYQIISFKRSLQNDVWLLGTSDVTTIEGISLPDTQRATHTAAPDANYQATNADTQIGFAVLTASRVVTLPDVDVYPLGQLLFIADESGQCSETVTITITVQAGSGDSIAGKSSHTLASPYQGQSFRRGAANLWIFA